MEKVPVQAPDWSHAMQMGFPDSAVLIDECHVF